MAVARASVADIRSESLAVRAAWQPGHLRCSAGCWHDSAVTQRQGEPELRCFTCRRRQAALLFSGYEARARWYPLLQGSRLAATAIIYRFFIRVFGSACLPKLASTISSPRAWVTGRRTRHCGRSSLSSDFDDVCHYEGRCAERETDVDVRANTGFVVAFALYVTKTWRLKKRTCGKLYVGTSSSETADVRRRRSGPLHVVSQLLSSNSRRRTFEHCTSCCPSRDATMVVLTKKKKKKKKKGQTPLTTPRKRSFEGRCQRWKWDVLSSPQFGGG